MKKRIFAMILSALLCLSLLAACGGGAVTAEKAQKIAMDYAGLKTSQVSDVHTHVIEQEGAPCFQVHMTTDSGEITIVIDAATGEVIGNG